jgi:uncharacterized protein HemX
MAGDAKKAEGSSTGVIVLAVVLALGAAGAVWWFQRQAAASLELLRRSKDEYKQMSERMKKPVEEYIRVTKKNQGTAQPGEDLLTFLDRKARQAQIPAGLFNIAKNTDSTSGAWKETSYTVTLRSAAKESPVRKGPVIDLLRLVETEQRSVKTKNLQLSFAGDDFGSAVITFSQFQQK